MRLTCRFQRTLTPTMPCGHLSAGFVPVLLITLAVREFVSLNIPYACFFSFLFFKVKERCPQALSFCLLWRALHFDRLYFYMTDLLHEILTNSRAAEEMISLRRTLTSFHFISQHSCCQDKIPAGFSSLERGKFTYRDLDSGPDCVAVEWK